MQADASCKRRAAAAVDTPAEPVDVVADEPDGRKAASKVDLDHVSLSRRVCDELSKHGEAGGHAAPWRRSSVHPAKARKGQLVDA